ncbi:MAG: gluconate 2-dehydrogenase subunit 3 family protein [Steroidobacteraceae bacterium]
MSSNDGLGEQELITRREAVLRVSALLGGAALIGGSALLSGCRDSPKPNADAPFTADEIAFLDEVADTILPTTSTPGAKAAKTGAFMALMVQDSYSARDRKVFREGMPQIDAASVKAHKVSFMMATPAQRLSVLEALDKDQKSFMEARADQMKKAAEAHAPDQRKEAAAGTDSGAATAITEDPPSHYFRMMKELSLLGYFTSEIGATQALRYVESPGRYDPSVDYHPGDKAWAPRA